MKVLLSALVPLLTACATTGGAAPSGAARAIDAVLASRPALAAQLDRSLPPTTLEAARSETGGWHVAVLSWGSGRPGILAAECFSVSGTGEVRPVGSFQNRETAEVRRIDLASCRPVTR